MNTNTNQTAADKEAQTAAKANTFAAITHGADVQETAGFILTECCYNSILFAHAVVEAMLSGKKTHQNVAVLEENHKVSWQLIPAINRLKNAAYTLSEHESRRLAGLCFLVEWWDAALDIEGIAH